MPNKHQTEQNKQKSLPLSTKTVQAVKTQENVGVVAERSKQKFNSDLFQKRKVLTGIWRGFATES